MFEQAANKTGDCCAIYLSGLLCYIKAIYLHLVVERSIIENALMCLWVYGEWVKGERKFLLRKMLKNQDWDDGKLARGGSLAIKMLLGRNWRLNTFSWSAKYFLKK